jgi:hypothetical protein
MDAEFEQPLTQRGNPRGSRELTHFCSPEETHS